MININNTLIIRNYMNYDLLIKTMINKDDPYLLNGKNGFYGEKLLNNIFFDKKIQDDYDYLVFIDEDCLVYNIDMIDKIILDMENNNYDIVGMPDGGNNIRIHRDDVPNLFFTIIKTKKMKNLNKNNFLNYKIPISISNKKNVNYDTFEPYYKTLCFLIYELGFNFLKLKENFIISDRATELIYDNIPFCIHTWHSRKYGIDINTKNRIDSIIDKYK